MPTFRHRPSSRRQPKPTASWLVLGPTETSAIKYGHRTTQLISCKPSHHRRRYHPDQRLAVKAYVGGPTECRVTIASADRITLGQLDYQTIRRLGYIRLDQFQVTWVEEHDQAWAARLQEEHPGDVMERFCRKEGRFHARHADKPMWLITFALDLLEPARLLAARSDELYVTTTATALPHEPEALSEEDWKRHVYDNRDLDHEQWVALGRMTNFDRKRRQPKHLRKAA